MANVSETGEVKVLSQYGVTKFQNARFHYDGGLKIERNGKLIALFCDFHSVEVDTSSPTATEIA